MNRVPLALTIVAIVVLLALLVFNIASDVLVKGYEGYPTTLMLGTLLGGALGIHRYVLRDPGRGDDS